VVRGDNTEGSSSSEPELTKTQQAVLVGTLLGDGCLAQHGLHHRLHVKHRGAHRALIEWKYSIFSSYVSMPIHSFDQRLNGKRYPCFQFASRTNPVFSKWHSRFYENGRKIVPLDVCGYLTPLSIAVWLMDDGAADYAGITFQTHCFTCEEVQLLAEACFERFGLAATLRKNKGRWILYIKASDVNRLQEIVLPFILPTLRYKLQPYRTRTP